VDLPALGGDVHADDGSVAIRTEAPVRDIHTLSGWALDRGITLSGLTLTRPSLEEVYLELTGESEHDN
jgi:ABC-2 type transport system ATP-binding protein